MSKRHQLLSQAVEGPQLRTLDDITPVDLYSPLIRQIVLEGQECQARIRRFRREGLVAWLEQANRLDIIHNVHNIVGAAFEKLAEEMGLDASTAYGLLQLHPFSARLLDECDRSAAADPKYRYPGWRTALAMMIGSRYGSEEVTQTIADNPAPFTWRHASDEWSKPQSVFELFDRMYHFDVDVAASRENAKCRDFWTKHDDGLKQQ